MKAKKAQEILKKVENDYAHIAEDFSMTRKKHEWKEFEVFKKYVHEDQIIADIGCGNGRLRDSFPQKIKYIGIDNNEKLLQESKKLHPSEKFIHGNLLDIPLASKITDVTFCIAALHHIPSSELRKKAVIELKRITKQKGYIIITVWNLWQKKYWKNILQALKKWLSGDGYQWNDLMISWSGKVDRYYHAFTQSELKKLLKKENLKIEKFFPEGHNYVAICRKK